VNTAKDWKAHKLGDLGEILGGGTPPTDEPSYWDGAIPWLVPTEVTERNDLFISNSERKITKTGLANSAATLLPAGTVMMTSRATIGDVAINTIPMATNQGFISTICDTHLVLNTFLAFWLMGNKRLLNQRASGVTFREISRSNFKQIPVLLPSLPEQQAIADFLLAIRKVIGLRQREIGLHQELFSASLDSLISGKVDVIPLLQSEFR
jgi:type I restriction enzyme S subunit